MWEILALAFTVGFMIPATIASYLTGRGLWWIFRRAVARSKPGTRIRHAMTRALPSKFPARRRAYVEPFI